VAKIGGIKTWDEAIDNLRSHYRVDNYTLEIIRNHWESMANSEIAYRIYEISQRTGFAMSTISTVLVDCMNAYNERPYPKF
jgi:uncharacterized Fe-S cluster-containing radical SAM superfamily protein